MKPNKSLLYLYKYAREKKEFKKLTGFDINDFDNINLKIMKDMENLTRRNTPRKKKKYKKS